MLKKGKYKIKVLNTINFAKSMHYNPFAYIRSEKDILKLVNTIIVNTKGEGQQSGEDFWVKAEKLYYTALIAYIWYEAPEEEQNFAMLIDMIDASEAREDDENFKNAVDLLFEELEADKPNHFAVRQYKKYKLAAGKTAKSILISCGARLAPFDIKELRDLMEYDSWSLILWERKRQHYSLLFPIPMPHLILWYQSCIHSSLTCFVIKQMMFITEGSRFMCVCSLMSLRTSGRFHSLRS